MKITKKPFVSIIVPFKTEDKYLIECLIGCKRLDYKPFEIIIVPDDNSGSLKIVKSPNVKKIISGQVYPSEKRNIAVKGAKGDIIAFIDSDAMPRKDWLKNAVKVFEDPQVAAVGGPNLIPRGAGVKERANVDIIYSKLCAGGSYPLKKYAGDLYEYRELAGSNLFVRKSIFEEFGGFDKYQLTSEDSKLCFQIRGAGRKVIYSPNVVVYHHRRGLFLKHAKRTVVQGRDKAFLLKEKFTKDAIVYLVPSLFTLGLFGGPFLMWTTQSTTLGWLWTGMVVMYICLIWFESTKIMLRPNWNASKYFLEPLLVFLGLPLTHVSYGVGFIVGLFQDKRKVKWGS